MKNTVDKMYVKDLERLISTQEKKIKKLEEEKAIREIGAAAFVECFIQEYDTVPDGLASRLRQMVKTTKWYSNKNRESEYHFEVSKYDYNALERAINKMFGVKLKELTEIGLHLTITDLPCKPGCGNDIDLDSLGFDEIVF